MPVAVKASAAGVVSHGEITIGRLAMRRGVSLFALHEFVLGALTPDGTVPLWRTRRSSPRRDGASTS